MADRDSSLRAVPAAFYGRTARAAGTGDSAADRHRQLALCRTVAAACGAQATAEFFDEDCRADDPWQDQPQGRSLLAALSGPRRPTGAVAVADPWRLLSRRPAPGEPGILARLAFRRVQLVLADSGLRDLHHRGIRPARQAPDRPRPQRRTAPPSPGHPSATGGRAAAGPPGCAGALATPMNAAPLDPGPQATAPVKRFAFKGRVSTEDNQDPEASRDWQISRSRALIESAGGIIVAEYFDIGQSRSLPWARRPRAAQLLADLANPGRGFDAVVIGEPQRAFYGNQYSLTMPVFTHYGVELWVPEVGGPIDPDSEAHDLIMSVFGGMSKGERNRIRLRVRAAMAAQAAVEGRFLGGRPPYGYRIADAGPHPNPAKAADGKRLHKLEPDPQAAWVVRRIFREYLAGRGLFAIAERLTRDRVPSPSQHDAARNPHRTGEGWAKSAVRAILRNPRYTGRQVWNKQRKDEVLLDVNDVARGYETRLRWNDTGQWVWSDTIAQEPLVSVEDFEAARAVMAGAGRAGRPATRPSAGDPALCPARPAVLRVLRPPDARPVQPRRRLLPVPLPEGIRPRRQRPPPRQRLPPRARRRARHRPLAMRHLRPAPPRPDHPRD